MAAILNFKMAATRGREYVGGIFFQLPLGGSTPVQSFMLASQTERFWWISGICRSTSSSHSVARVNKKAQLMLAYPRDAKTMKKIPPFRSYNKFQLSRKSGVYSK